MSPPWPRRRRSPASARPYAKTNGSSTASELAAKLLDLVQEPARHGHRRHLAAGDLLALRDRLPVHHGEHRNRAESVDCVHELTAHTHEAAPRGDQPRLALHRRPGLETGRGQCRGQASGGLVLVHVAGLELDEVDLARAANRVQVRGGEHGTLAQSRRDVVHEHAAPHILRAHVLSLQPVRTHSWEHRYVRLYNTLTRRKEALAPVDAGGVKVYCCGPTVYRSA